MYNPMNIVIAMTEEEIREAVQDLIESLERKDPINASLLKEVMRKYREMRDYIDEELEQ